MTENCENRQLLSKWMCRLGNSLILLEDDTYAIQIDLQELDLSLTGLGPGEEYIGKVGGDSAQIAPTVTVDTAAYTAGDCIGGKLTLTDAMRTSDGTGLLQSVFLMDRSGTQKPALELLIFNADPSASTLTDQAAVSIHADDVSKIIRRISIATTDWVLVGGIYMVDLSPGSRVLKAVGSANLYAAIVAVGAPDFVAATDLSVRFGILRD